MKVVHLALTPLAGAPIRLVRALNRHTTVQARLVNANPAAYGTRVFDEDIDWRTQRAEALDAIAGADLVHCHHWMDLRRNPFGVDLSRRRVLRHFHSEPGFVAHHARITPQTILDDERPQLVVGQFHERLYPGARPVPNLLDFERIDEAERAVAAAPQADAMPRVAFQPTTDTPAAADRWNTKGAPETRRLLGALAARHGFEADIATDLPHGEALQRKRRAAVVIDEMVTGSFHLSGLEALALGRPTFGWLDARMTAVLAAFTGSDSLPWINLPLHQLEEPLLVFLESRDLRDAVGEQSRRWMRLHWDTARLVQAYVRAYEDVANGRTRLRETPAFEVIDVAMQDFGWRQHIAALERRLQDLP